MWEKQAEPLQEAEWPAGVYTSLFLGMEGKSHRGENTVAFGCSLIRILMSPISGGDSREDAATTCLLGCKWKGLCSSPTVTQ